jgi:20S proteasome alpha/beta subunit
MTLVTAAQGKDLIIVGADSRGTFGRPEAAFSSYDVMEKIIQLSPHVVALTYGVGEIGDNLLIEFRRSLTEPIDGVTEVVHRLHSFCLGRWNEWFARIPFQFRPVVAYIVAGLDKKDKEYCEPHIYSLDSRTGFAPAIHIYGWAHGGVPMYAIYIFGRKYRPNMEMRELIGLVAYAISETATQDMRVGGAIRMMKITRDGVQIIDEKEIRSCLEEYYRRER